MGAKFNREDVSLGAIPVGQYPTDSTTTPAPLDLPNRAVDWGVLAAGSAAQVLTVQANGSVGWSAAAGGLTNPMTTAGDSIYGGASGAPTRLGIGTAGQVLTVNAGATAPQWSTYGLTSGTTGVASGTSGGLLYDSSNTLACTANLLITDSTETIAGTGTTSLALSSSNGSKLSYNSTNYLTVGNGSTSLSGYFALNTNDFGPAGIAFTRTLGATFALLSVAAQNYYFQAASSTSTTRNCGYIIPTFNVNTDASWTGILSLYAGDYTSTNAGKRLGIQIESNGSAALIGLFGATPVVKPVGGGNDVTNFTAVGGTAATSTSTWTGASGASTYTVGDIVTALKALGILTA